VQRSDFNKTRKYDKPYPTTRTNARG